MISDMKNLFITILCFVLCFSCSKNENKVTAETSMPNSAKLISDTKGKQTFGITIRVGHSAAGCPGCVTSGGQQVHMDCQGSGSDCQKIGTVGILSSGGVTYYGIVDDPDELTYDDSFLMPDRSLYIIGSNGEFLNIPEQLLYRDEETGTFIFYDIFFSDVQMFENK